MRIRLLRHTDHPDQTCAIAARVCYAAAGIDELSRAMTRPQVRRILEQVIASGHHSVLEHASFTFGIEGVSRALLAQLTRHRIASFSVQSQRYVRMKGALETVVPPSVGASALRMDFSRAIASVKDLYDRLLAAGIPAEDARYILPQASATKIIMTMNGRELRHFFSLRCCNRAQWEIRAMACRMHVLARAAAPVMMRTAGPSCVYDRCHESSPCGHPWPRA